MKGLGEIAREGYVLCIDRDKMLSLGGVGVECAYSCAEHGCREKIQKITGGTSGCRYVQEGLIERFGKSARPGGDLNSEMFILDIPSIPGGRLYLSQPEWFGAVAVFEFVESAEGSNMIKTAMVRGVLEEHRFFRQDAGIVEKVKPALKREKVR